MLATFAFDVCHDVYRSAREVIDTKIPTLNMESSGKYTWHPDRLPRLAEYVADFARAGERALGGGMAVETVAEKNRGGRTENGERGVDGDRRGEKFSALLGDRIIGRADGSTSHNTRARLAGSFRPSRMAMFRVYYLGGAEYHAARRHLGISELTWADWAEEIRTCVGRELTRSGVFPPSKYFREPSAKAS